MRAERGRRGSRGRIGGKGRDEGRNSSASEVPRQRSHWPLALHASFPVDWSSLVLVLKRV